MVYLGVDLHRKRSVVTVLAEDGTVLLSRRIASRPEDFQRVFGELEPWSLSVAFEATYGWFWFADLLADAGIEAHMAHPLATKTIAARYGTRRGRAKAERRRPEIEPIAGNRRIEGA